jgi:hypothetical protein
MGSIVFVHGTGVRLASYKPDFENARKLAQRVGIQETFIPCAWGDPLGVDFHGKSIPCGLAKSAQAPEGSDPQEQDDSRWTWLFHAPLFELHQFTTPDPDASSQWLPPGSKSKGQQAWVSIATYKPSQELVAILDRANLNDYWQEAWNSITDSPIAKDAFEATFKEIPEVCRAFARAIVAQLHGIAITTGKQGPNRIVRYKIVDRLLEDWGQKTLGVGQIAWNLFTRLGTPLLRSYRGTINNFSALKIGDVLLYQSRGQEVRESLPEKFPPWLNFYDQNDFLSYIAKPFWPGVIDHEVRSGQPFPDAHGAYFGSEDVWTKIREFMQ